MTLTPTLTLTLTLTLALTLALALALTLALTLALALTRSVGTEKAAERVTAAHEAEEAGGPSSIAQIAFKPKWIDEAKRKQAWA